MRIDVIHSTYVESSVPHLGDMAQLVCRYHALRTNGHAERYQSFQSFVDDVNKRKETE